VQKLCHGQSGQFRGLGRSPGADAHYYGRRHVKRWSVSEQRIVGGRDMDNFRIDDIARRLLAALPEGARTMRRDIESNFRAVLQSSLGRLDLTTREEFEVQSKVLERTRARIEQLEQRIVTLEQRLGQFEQATPPIAD
jgi:ubiquinone biosynthesis accessory factor UbiK